jgi:hypothetical protein
MNKETYREYISGKVITHAAILNARNIAFGLKEVQVDENDIRSSEDRATTALSYAPDRLQHQGGFGDDQWSTGIEGIFVAYNSLDEGIVYCDTIFNTFEPKNSDVGEFYPVLPKPDQDDYTRLSQNIKYIDGEAYITGHLRKVFKRTGIFEWIDITDPKEHPNLFEELAALKARQGHYGGCRAGFSAIDGFSNADIYAAGRDGDAWHYDGKVWRSLDLPGNFDIKTITCGSDGNVYFAGYTGGIIKGTIDHCTNIDERGGKVINETAWFQGKLYLSDERNLFTLEEDKLVPYEYPGNGPQQYSFYGVASSQDALVAYGPHQALVFDGQGWEEIIGSPALSGDA